MRPTKNIPEISISAKYENGKISTTFFNTTGVKIEDTRDKLTVEQWAMMTLLHSVIQERLDQYKRALSGDAGE